MLEIPITPTERQMLEEMAQLEGFTLDEYLVGLVQREIILLGTLHKRHPHLFETGAN